MIDIQILSFGIAKEITQTTIMTMQVESGQTVGALKAKLIEAYPEFQKLASLKLALNGTYVEDDVVIDRSSEVAIIPPVSGG